MNQSAVSCSASRSVFREEVLTVEKFTQLWITLINQIERDKQVLSPAR